MKKLKNTADKKLYAHRNGIVDEKFFQYNNDRFNVNEVHLLSICNFLNHFLNLIETIDRLDKSTPENYQLLTFELIELSRPTSNALVLKNSLMKKLTKKKL